MTCMHFNVISVSYMALCNAFGVRDPERHTDVLQGQLHRHLHETEILENHERLRDVSRVVQERRVEHVLAHEMLQHLDVELRVLPVNQPSVGLVHATLQDVQRPVEKPEHALENLALRRPFRGSNQVDPVLAHRLGGDANLRVLYERLEPADRAVTSVTDDHRDAQQRVPTGDQAAGLGVQENDVLGRHRSVREA